MKLVQHCAVSEFCFICSGNIAMDYSRSTRTFILRTSTCSKFHSSKIQLQWEINEDDSNTIMHSPLEVSLVENPEFSFKICLSSICYFNSYYSSNLQPSTASSKMKSRDEKCWCHCAAYYLHISFQFPYHILCLLFRSYQ